MSLRNIFPTGSIALLLVLVLLSAGCQEQELSSGVSGKTGLVSHAPLSANAAQLSVFLKLQQAEGERVVLEISAVDVQQGDSWVSLNSALQNADTKSLATSQRLLGRNTVPPGTFEAIRLTVQRAVLHRGSKETMLNLVDPVVVVPIPESVSVRRGDSTSLFLSWDVEKSLQGSAVFKPVLYADLQHIPLLQDLLFVACPEINTVYAVRTDTNFIIGSIGIPGQPLYVELDFAAERLYVLTAADAKIKVVDLTRNEVRDQFDIPMLPTPTFMTLSPDFRSAYLLDMKNNAVVRLDLATGVVAAQAEIEYQPLYALFIADQGQLAISASFTKSVYLLDPERLTILDKFIVGDIPDGMIYLEDQVYITEGDAGSVTVFDLKNRKILHQINTGVGPHRLVVGDSQIFVANRGSGSVSVLLPGQLNAFSQIDISGEPGEMVFSETRRWLYVGDAESGVVAVIDPGTYQVVNRIELAARPQGLTIVK